MASVNKNFVVKYGLEVNKDLILADAYTRKVGIGTSNTNYELEVYGNLKSTNLDVTGIASVKNLEITGGYLEADNSKGNPGQYLRSTGTGIEWASFPSYRTSGKFVAGVGQTVFNYAYHPGFIDLYLNGIKLVEEEYIATDGVRIYLKNACFGGENFEIIGYNPVTVSAGGTGILGITVLEEGSIVGNDNGITSLNFVGAAITAVGTGAGVTVYFPKPIGWDQSNTTIYANSNVGIGTSIARYPLEVGSVGSSSTSLWVNGNARISGILSIGSSTVVINGYDNTINVGSGITIFGNSGIISATNLYVNGIGVTNLVAGASVSISTTPPLDPDPGNLWFSSSLGRGFIYYNDGSSEQWVDFSPVAASSGLNVGAYWKTNPLGIHTISNVGIGTNVLSPSSTLTVSGNVAADSFTGNLSGTATTANNLSNAANINAGTISSSRLSGDYNINIIGKANLAEYSSISGIASNAINATTSTNVVGGIASVTDLEVSTTAKILNLTFPSGTGLPGQTLVTDGSGNLGFSTAGVLFENRIYVSSKTGNDTNDGKYSPVKTIKKAAQLASIQGGPIAIFVESGEYIEDNPIILYEDVSIIGDNLRNTIIRPLNAGKDMFRVRNGCYVTGFTLKDNVNSKNAPQHTFNYAVVFDDPDDGISRTGYAGGQVNITNALYSNTTGLTTITTASPHSFKSGSTVRLSGIAFTCNYDNGATPLNYPESNQSGIRDFPIVSIDSPTQFTVRTGISTIEHYYAGGGNVRIGKPLITRSPYVQNCSIISFLGANGVLVDGSKVRDPNIPSILEEVEKPALAPYPQQGKSMIANAFTMISFGGTGWRCINDGYAQIVSCFQLFCLNGSYCQSGGYLSITNSATNFGLYALRSSGYSTKSYKFDRGLVSIHGTFEGKQTLKIIGAGRSDQNLYVMRIFDQNLVDRTGQFKASGITTVTFDGVTGINTSNNEITSLVTHGLVNGDSVIYTQNSSGPVGLLINQSQYYVEVTSPNTFKLYEDEVRQKIVSLSPTSAGIHTFQKGNSEFFINKFLSATNNYQELTLDSSAYKFVPGRLITQPSTAAVGYALTYYSNKLIVAKESNVDFNVGTINDHSFVPSTATVNSFVGLTTYYTLNAVVDSTQSGEQIQNIGNLPENYYIHLHRPSIVNSSSHTWEFAGSGIDYNALPENGGQANSKFEQVSERGGRVYTSGTNELGDFKVGDAITAFNRTGDIIFNNTVTIGELSSLKFKVANGPEITEVSTDIDLGDNDPGGAQDSRLTTQKAQRSFLNNRLGSFIDKATSTSSVPNAIVVLNSSGQLNTELIPLSRSSNYYTLNVGGGRTTLVDDVPASDLLAGDYVVEDTGITTFTYQLINDKYSQYLVLSNPSRDYNFIDGQLITSINNGAVGVATAPTNVGYGTSPNVKGVLRTVEILDGGSGYTPGIYTNVSVASSTGIGSFARANVTVGAGGQVIDIDLKYGGKGYNSGDILRITSIPISGSNYASLNVLNSENRLYLRLLNNIKFSATALAPDFIQDGDAVGLQTSVTSSYSLPFDALNNVETGINRIEVGINSYADGDPVIYDNGGNVSIGGLVHGNTYYVKRVGISSIELYTNYGLTNILSLVSSGTGIQQFIRNGISTSSNFVILENHGYYTGDAVKVNGSSLPAGITTNNFYFVGSVVQNGFTLHNYRSDAFASINGLTVNSIDLTSSGIGTATFTKQNVQFNSVVNTSSSVIDNYSIISADNIDASNIISGVISPSRLGTESATSDTFLSGNSTYQKVAKGVGIGSTEPINLTGSSGFANSSGFTTYYGNVNISLNRINGTLGDSEYTNLGVSKFKKSTFAFDGGDGAIRIKTSAQGGDVDAAKLNGNDSLYYLNPSNLQSAVPVTKGGTNLTSLPPLGSILVGNGTAYNLTENPIIGGTLGAVSITATNLNISGITTVGFVTATNAHVSGIVTVGFITSTDSYVSGIATVGFITASNAYVSGIATVGFITASNVYVSGIATVGFITASNAYVSGIATVGLVTSTDAYISGIATVGFITASNAYVSEIATVGFITASNVYVSGVCTAQDFNAQSDFRLKENIHTYENALSTVDKLRGVSFTWKENQRNSIGVIAQEIEEVIPELVISGEVKTVNYNGIIGVLIEAVKELKNENKLLNEKIDKLNDLLNNK